MPSNRPLPVRHSSGSPRRAGGDRDAGTDRLAADALLLDMDGVLVDSSGAVEEHWARWAARRGLHVDDVLRHAHGAPGREVVRLFVAEDEVAVEAAWVEGLALEDCEEVALPGAAAVLAQRLLPVAVVTSATAEVARARLTRAALPVPGVLVGADDAPRGKPAPDPYLRAAALLGVDARSCVGVEDSPTGLAALRAAGTPAVAVSTTHPVADLATARAVVPHLGALRLAAGSVGW